jgi:ribosome maturation factor RimP
MRETEQIVESVRSLASPIVRALDLNLVEVQCAGQGARTVLRVFIDRPGGVSVGDCEQVHLSLGHALDVADPIPHAYTLEVSSPGLDRPLKQRPDYERTKGQLITLKLKAPQNGEWRVSGRLLEVDDDGLTLLESRHPEQPRRVRWDEIAEARREITF